MPIQPAGVGTQRLSNVIGKVRPVEQYMSDPRSDDSPGEST